MNERERIIEAARLQRTMLRIAGTCIVMWTCVMLLWSLIDNWDWVTYIAIPGTLLSVVAMGVVNVALQIKLRAPWMMIAWPGVILAGLGAWSAVAGHLGPILIGVLPVLLADCAAVNGSVTRGLTRAGVRVGFLGAGEAELRRLASGVCFFCGYDMSGLPTAVCPECGKESVLRTPIETQTSR